MLPVTGSSLLSEKTFEKTVHALYVGTDFLQINFKWYPVWGSPWIDITMSLYRKTATFANQATQCNVGVSKRAPNKQIPLFSTWWQKNLSETTTKTDISFIAYGSQLEDKALGLLTKWAQGFKSKPQTYLPFPMLCWREQASSIQVIGEGANSTLLEGRQLPRGKAVPVEHTQLNFLKFTN